MIEWLDGIKKPFWISLFFFEYCIVAKTPITNPTTQAKIPRNIAKVFVTESELILIVKCKEVVKKPTPAIDIAVRIQAR